MDWLEYKTGCMPTNPTLDEETAALHAVLEWLKPIPDYPRSATPEQREELRELRLRVTRTATDRLRELERETAGADTIPWEGDDWDALEPQVRQLLQYMHGRERADLRELCPVVWGKEYLGDNGVSEQARETATSKANRFLAKGERPRRLRKVRGEPFLRWE